MNTSVAQWDGEDTLSAAGHTHILDELPTPTTTLRLACAEGPALLMRRSRAAPLLC